MEMAQIFHNCTSTRFRIIPEIMGCKKHQCNNSSIGIKYTIIIVTLIRVSILKLASILLHTFNPRQPPTRWLIIG